MTTILYKNGKEVYRSVESLTIRDGIWGKRNGVAGMYPVPWDEKREWNTMRQVSIVPKYWKWGWWQDATPAELEAEGIDRDAHIARSFLKPWIWKVKQGEVKDGYFHLWTPAKGLRYIGWKPQEITYDRDVYAKALGIPEGPALMYSYRTGFGDPD